MAYLRIPTPDSTEPLVSQRTTLDGQDYVFTFDWIGREQKWYMKISDTNGTVLLAGAKLVTNIPLLQTLASEGSPPGELVVLTTDNLDPTINTLQDAVLLYISEEEFS